MRPNIDLLRHKTHEDCHDFSAQSCLGRLEPHTYLKSVLPYPGVLRLSIMNF